MCALRWVCGGWVSKVLSNKFCLEQTAVLSICISSSMHVLVECTGQCPNQSYNTKYQWQIFVSVPLFSICVFFFSSSTFQWTISRQKSLSSFLHGSWIMLCLYFAEHLISRQPLSQQTQHITRRWPDLWKIRGDDKCTRCNLIPVVLLICYISVQSCSTLSEATVHLHIHVII